MSTLLILEWNDDEAWVMLGAWSLSAFVERIGSCTELKGTELKRVARGVRNRELFQIENICVEKANPLFHTLESLGVKFSVW